MLCELRTRKRVRRVQRSRYSLRRAQANGNAGATPKPQASQAEVSPERIDAAGVRRDAFDLDGPRGDGGRLPYTVK